MILYMFLNFWLWNQASSYPNQRDAWTIIAHSCCCWLGFGCFIFKSTCWFTWSCGGMGSLIQYSWWCLRMSILWFVLFIFANQYLLKQNHLLLVRCSSWNLLLIVLQGDDPYFNKLIRILATRCMTQVH